MAKKMKMKMKVGEITKRKSGYFKKVAGGKFKPCSKTGGKRIAKTVKVGASLKKDGTHKIGSVIRIKGGGHRKLVKKGSWRACGADGCILTKCQVNPKRKKFRKK